MKQIQTILKGQVETFDKVVIIFVGAFLLAALFYIIWALYFVLNVISSPAIN